MFPGTVSNALPRIGRTVQPVPEITSMSASSKLHKQSCVLDIRCTLLGTSMEQQAIIGTTYKGL